MAHFVIDLMGDDDVIAIKPEDPEKEARRKAMKKLALEEIFRRAPQPALEIVPISPRR